MKKCFLLIGFVSTLPLVACNKGPEKVDYEQFYNKIQEIEDHHYSYATLALAYSDSISGDGSTIEATLNYTWSEEANNFIPDEEYEYDLAESVNKTIKDKCNRSQESEDAKELGYKYYINPFKVYIDYTETIEDRTVRIIESSTYDKYGYLTNYLLEVTAKGTYKGEIIDGTQKASYSISYK